MISKTDICRIRRVSPEPPLNIAHRGGAGLAPENTMAAFLKAHALRADAIEFDVRRTCDNVPVVFHDRDLKRITGGKEIVKDMTFKELHRTAGEIPSLLEVLQFSAKTKIKMVIELKNPGDYPGIEEQVLSLLALTGTAASTMIASFDPLSLERIRISEPALPLVRNYRFDLPDSGVKYRAASVDSRNLRFFPWRISKYREHSDAVFSWRVNSVSLMITFLKLGADGLITDYPDRLRALLDEVYKPMKK